MLIRGLRGIFHKRSSLTTSLYKKSTRAQPEFTATRYPNVKRGDYGRITPDDVVYFKSVMNSTSAVLIDGEELDKYNVDWIRTVRGQSSLVLRPESTEEVALILRHCNSRRLAVCPQGGNTGLVGGSVPVFDEIVLSTERMNDVISVDAVSGIVTCQAGCVLEALDQHVSSHGLLVPLDLGAKGSCHIGGNVATNAGGLRLLRYGSLRGSVLGIQAVLASGEIVDCLTGLRKDNTGYDIKQLLIGSEGTLGVITAVSILCPPRPAAQNVAFLGCESFSRVLDTFVAAKQGLGEILSAYEFMDASSMECVRRNLRLETPLAEKFPHYVLLETSGSLGAHDEEKLEGFLQGVLEKGLVLDGVLATEPSKINYMWSLRERIAEALLHDGYCYKYDVSLPLSNYYTLVDVMRERLGAAPTTVCGYGHVGDGNLHFNVTSGAYNAEMKGQIEPFVYDYVSDFRGSVSAEHGLGFAKRAYIYHSKPRPVVALMHSIKQLLDPNAILNPYKTLPDLDS